MSASGPSRRLAATQRYVRGWRFSRHCADIARSTRVTRSRHQRQISSALKQANVAFHPIPKCRKCRPIALTFVSSQGCRDVLELDDDATLVKPGLESPDRRTGWATWCEAEFRDSSAALQGVTGVMPSNRASWSSRL